MMVAYGLKSQRANTEAVTWGGQGAKLRRLGTHGVCVSELTASPLGEPSSLTSSIAPVRLNYAVF
jgi:hypothetical protein